METKTKIDKLLREASQDTQAVITETFKVEREKLYQANPRRVPTELVAVIKELIK